ncbi:nicotinate-nucleotide pyrophosphorylase (carboxylating) [Bacillus sp. SORGH_AS 510]|uniref:carboxylating nicotinate-nucleotide diphosphorylase n=1 Tax=Bacillus sp. SORGH_AS_0510 TaxID=3041771 RepID=UPI0027851152|nr:carboxylating nicotinate-nucleotide diphosphorylase [Bacillus sp. SORGH_AS_0510]MDQ1144890.1 nicotinate-nucleotide pyrophosphorylase (carboxylating) [Bacillus sp. SORGH_AS_0510]
MNTIKLRSLLEKFFIEDIGEQDITTDLIFANDTKGEIVFLAKEAGVFCGEEIIKTGFQLLHAGIKTQVFVKDGQSFEIGQELAHVSGKISDLLKGERVILNLVQRMSGIATLTRKTVDTLDSSHTKVCDTRKTTPGLRMFEKYAVRCGGGFNHRFGLYDGVMIKDNHISFAGSITKAVDAVREKAGHMVKVEVEVETADQVMEAVNAGADVIMFDNRTPEEIKELIKLVPPSIITEASGGIQLANIADYRQTGVDYISLGYLTHSYKALDISVKVRWNKGDE